MFALYLPISFFLLLREWCMGDTGECVSGEREENVSLPTMMTTERLC